MSAAEPTLDLGDLGLGRYERLEPIGRGSTAIVYRGRDRTTGREVVIKEMSPHLQSDAVSVERFRREMQVTRLIGHPQVVAVLEVLEEDGGLQLVMELAPGISLKDHVRLSGPLPCEEAVKILAQILDIVAACHARQIIHRDLKPQNIMLDDGGTVRLLDFGIARMTSLADLTQTGSSLGTPEYMAPEQFATSRCDHRVDLYALGVIAYELLTGQVPFKGDSLAVLYQRHAGEAPPPPGTIRSEIPDWLERFVMRLLEKRPHRRYQLATQALEDLTTRRVAKRDAVRAPQRECALCRGQTLRSYPICTGCGADERALGAPGTVDLFTAAGTDGRLLAKFIQGFFKISHGEIHPHRSQLVVGHVNTLLASVIVARAKEQGVVLLPRSVKRVEISPQTRLIAGGGLVAVIFGMLSGLRLGDGSEALLQGVIGFFAGMGATFVLERLRGETNRPLVTWLEGGTSATRLLKTELLRLRGFFASRVSPRIKETVAAVVEGHYLIIDRMLQVEPARLQLDRLAQAVVKVAELLFELDGRVSEEEIAALSHAFLEAKRDLEERPDPKSRSRLAKVSAKLHELQAVEERLDGLHARLIHLLYAYDSLLGGQLAGQAALNGVEAAAFSDAVAALALDVSAGLEAKSELAGKGA